MLRTFTAIVTALLVVGAARASPYWIDYEASSGQFPEQQGWTRLTSHGGDQRSFTDGWLVMDGSADPGIYDYSLMMRPVDPDPGAVFVMMWRLRVDEVMGGTDPWVSVHSDAKWAAGFTLSESAIFSVFEDGVSAPFEPGLDHVFELESADMRTYVLSIDGTPAINGAFWLSLTGPAVAWGDGVYGAASLSAWKCFQFGTVPECSTITLASTVAVLCVALRNRTGR